MSSSEWSVSMQRSITQRPIRTSIVVAVIATLALVTPAAVIIGACSSAYASTMVCTISRGEVINRAQYWVNRHPTYNQNAHLRDLDDDGHLYRTDCSGFISMAWHLSDTNGGPNTQGLMNY